MMAPDWYISHPLSVLAVNDEPCDLITLHLNRHARSGHDGEAARMMSEFARQGLCESGWRGVKRAWWMTAEQRKRWIDECRAIHREYDGPDPEPHRLDVPAYRPRAAGWETWDTVEYLK